MFRRVFDPYLTLQDSGRDIYQLLAETCARPTYVTINIENVHFQSRILTPPHFSYANNFFAQARLSSAAWNAFRSDFAADAATLQSDKRVWPVSSDGVTPIELRGADDPIRSKISVEGWQVLNAYFIDPYDMLADALAQEFKSGVLSFDSATGHLKRSQGPCRFCVNDEWTFPEGCGYKKPDLPPTPPGELEKAVATILSRARQARAERELAAGVSNPAAKEKAS